MNAFTAVAAKSTPVRRHTSQPPRQRQYRTKRNNTTYGPGSRRYWYLRQVQIRLLVWPLQSILGMKVKQRICMTSCEEGEDTAILPFSAIFFSRSALIILSLLKVNRQWARARVKVKLVRGKRHVMCYRGIVLDASSPYLSLFRAASSS
jgi:hypothetical protein